MFLRRVLQITWWLAAFAIVGLAVALSAARLLLPGMSDYKAQIESVAQDFLERPVRIGSLDAAWHGLSPVLKLEHVVIEDKQFPEGELAIDEVHIALDVVDSLANRQWLTAGIKLIGTTLSLNSNLVDRGKGSPDLGILAWLLQQESIAVEGLQLNWSDPGLFERPVQLTDLSLRLVNEGRRHQLLLQIALPDSIGESLKLAADLEGGNTELQDWQGRIYIKAGGLDLDIVNRVLSDSAISSRGKMDFELWAGIRERRLEWGSGSFSMDDARFENATPDAQGFSADRLSSDFQWRSNKTGWQVELKEIELQRDDQTVWPASAMSLHIELGEMLRVQGDATLLVLDELNSLLPLLPWIDPDALTMIDRLQPEGRFRDAEFEFTYAKDSPPGFSARATIEDLQFAANGGLPGWDGLSGTIEGNLQAGTLYLDSTHASLTLPKVFPETLALSRLKGTVRWQRYADMFRIESRQLAVKSDQVGFLARLQLDWPYDKASPWLDVQLALDDFPLNGIGAYLPSRVMSPKAVGWLERAFQSGVATNVNFLLQGSLDRLPYDSGEGRLEARFDFEDVQLDYHPLWGRLDELNGSALFDGRSMWVTGTSARILDSPITGVVAVIDNLKKPVLEIDGTVGGTLAGMLEYVNTTPLSKRFGDLIEVMDVTGEARLQLDLDIPLIKQLGKFELEGYVAMEGNDLLPQNSEFALTDVRGELRFTRDSIQAEEARAKLLGQPVLVSVYQQGLDDAVKTVVDIKGKLKLIERLKTQQVAAAPYLEGQTQWHALLKIGRQTDPDHSRLEVELRSDLKGVSISLPEPFSKQAEQSRELLIGWVPGQESRLPIRADYGDLVNAYVLLKAGGRGIRKADIRFGGDIAHLPEADAIQLSGYLEGLDLGRWISVFTSDSKGGSGSAPLTVDLAVGDFSLAGTHVKGIKVESRLPDPWYFLVEGGGASGWVRWLPAGSSRPAKVMSKLDHLALVSRKQQPGPGDSTELKPGRLPEMDIGVGSLHWNQRALGHLRLLGNQTQQGINFDTLDINSKAIVFKGRGAWMEEEGRQSTSFSADIQGGELGELIKLLGSGGAVKGGRLSGNLELNWLGSPADFSMKTLEGDLFLKVIDGRLVSLDEGGAAKLLSLFSLNSLQRRLSLDFSDVFKEGFSFDKMQGHFIVMEGDAFTNDFSIKGSSATIEIAGRTGLVTQDYDQLVTVTPQLSSTLPIAGAIAGGPAVGAAVFLADKLVGDTFNRITRLQYQVTGSWEEPVYKRLDRENKGSGDGDGSFEDEP